MPIMVGSPRGLRREMPATGEQETAVAHVAEIAGRRPRAEDRLDLADLVRRDALDGRRQARASRLGLEGDSRLERVEPAQDRLPDVAILLHGLRVLEAG